MKIIITLAGKGKRFLDNGYSDIKPLIKVCNKHIIDYVCDMYPKNSEFIFICRNEDLVSTNLSQVLDKYKGTIIGIETHTKGPVYSVSKIFNLIHDDEPIIVNYCDFFHLWDFNQFKKIVTDVDGCIITHTGFHPHRLNNISFAFIKHDGENILQVLEKKSFTNNPIDEPASNGTYYFKSGKILKYYFSKLIEKNINYNEEFYVTLPFNLMIEDKLKVILYNTDFFVCLGIPEDVENFESWLKILKWNHIKNNDDLKKTFNYWKNYCDILKQL